MLSIISRQDLSRSRRCSTETVFSIQGRETDYVRDTSDTEAGLSDDSDLEYEPVSDLEDDEEVPVDEDTSEESDNNIIKTKVIEMSVDDGELHFADSEDSDTKESDSEMDLYDFWLCTQCRTRNNNPMYSYCQKCFKVRKNFFPPRPKPKTKRKTKIVKIDEIPRTYSQDSGVHSSGSQELQDQGIEEFPDFSSQDLLDFPDLDIQKIKELPVLDDEDLQDLGKPGEGTSSKFDTPFSSSGGVRRKRRGDSIDVKAKRSRLSRTDSDSDSDDDVKKVTPLIKSVSDPAITIEANNVKITKKIVANTLIQNLEGKDLCVVCVTEPKSGVFVHGRIAHICCCYKCAVKVWAKARRCPVCNCKVSNVLKAVVM